jgi:O-antigen/teichoic acid export membrane protein
LISHLYNLGINLSSSKFVSEYLALKDEKKLNTIYSTTLLLNIISSIITSIILGIVLFLVLPSQIAIEPDYTNIYVLSSITLIIGVFFQNILSTYIYILRGFQRDDIVIFITTITNLLIVIFKILFIILGLNFLGLIISDYVFINILALSIFFIIRKRSKNLKFNINLIKWKDIKKFSSQGISYYFSNLEESFFIDLNTILIPQLLSIKNPSADPKEYITIYGAILRISRYEMALTTSLSGGQVGIATELYTKGKYEKFRDLFGRLFNLTLFLSIIIASGVSIMAPKILLHYIGPTFQDAWPLLVSFTFMYAIRMSVFLCKRILQSMDLMHKVAYIGLFEYGLIILFSVLGFFIYDLIGISFGVFLAVSIYSCIILFYTAKKIEYPIKILLKKLIKIFIAVIIPSIILYGLIYFNLIPFSDIEGLIYLIFDLIILAGYSGVGLLIFYLIKGFRKEDIDALKRTIKGIYKSIKRRISSLLKYLGINH